MAPESDRRVWLFGLGYFICYAFYSGLIKQVTIGSGEPSGLRLLPSVTFGTALTLPLLVTVLGIWRRPRFDRHTLMSGVATGVIIVTTTLAYSFDGVSIVFALLLLRGGVLILAPVVDRSCGREVRQVCWFALFLSLGAIIIALTRTGDTRMTWVAAVNTCAYIGAYAVRLPEMTRHAKTAQEEPTRGWFVGEMIVAVAVQLLLPLLGAAVLGSAGAGLRSGLTRVEPAGFLIGVLYGGLYFFGTRVYLDRRENSFCVPLNRGASLLAGVVASIAIGRLPSLPELAGVSLIVTALLVLAPLHHLGEHHGGAWDESHAPASPGATRIVTARG